MCDPQKLLFAERCFSSSTQRFKAEAVQRWRINSPLQQRPNHHAAQHQSTKHRRTGKPPQLLSKKGQSRLSFEDANPRPNALSPSTHTVVMLQPSGRVAKIQGRNCGRCSWITTPGIVSRLDSMKFLPSSCSKRTTRQIQFKNWRGKR